MVVQPDGRIVVVGAIGSLRSPSMLAVRFDRDGTLDRSLGSEGR